MQRISLVIMAAGIGSRFGTGIKQLTKIDNDDNIIINYSIADAINTGFNDIVFIIRKDIEDDFKNVIGNKIERLCNKNNISVRYAYQELNAIPTQIQYNRTKPWGTGQAVLSVQNLINNPFAVINADDYYGKEAFRLMYHWLNIKCKPNNACMVGFTLKNTLSETGGVTRGICKINKNNKLEHIVETYNIIYNNEIITSDSTTDIINPNSVVSMNIWGFHPSILKELNSGFKAFFENIVPNNPQKCEYLLPTIIGQLVNENKLSVDVLSSSDKWFGITYKEDTEKVVKEFQNMIIAGIYTLPLQYKKCS